MHVMFMVCSTCKGAYMCMCMVRSMCMCVFCVACASWMCIVHDMCILGSMWMVDVDVDV